MLAENLDLHIDFLPYTGLQRFTSVYASLQLFTHRILALHWLGVFHTLARLGTLPKSVKFSSCLSIC